MAETRATTTAAAEDTHYTPLRARTPPFPVLNVATPRANDGDLRDRDEDDEDGPANRNTASMSTTAFNILNNTVGSAMLSIPWATKKMNGYLNSGLLLVFVALLCFSSHALMGYICDRYPHITTFDAVIRNARRGASKVSTGTLETTPPETGAAHYLLPKLLLIFYTWGSCLSYVLISCDVLVGHGGLMTSLFEDVGDVLARLAAALLLLAFVLYPFSRIKNLAGAKSVSYLSFAAMISLVVLAGVEYSRNNDDVSSDVDADADEDGPSRFGFFLAEPIYTIAFACHYNTPRFYHELRSHTPRRFALASFTGVAMSFAVYASFGFVSFATFQVHTKPNVLENYGRDLTGILARLMSLFVVITTFPLAFHALVSAVESWWGGATRPEGETTKGSSPWLRWTVLLLSSLPAAVMRDISLLLDLKGALLGGAIVYFVAGWAHARLVEPRELTFRVLNAFLQVWAVPSSVVAMIVLGFKLFSK